MSCCSVSSLKVSTIVLGSIGLVIWPLVVGFTCGYGFHETNRYYANPVETMMLSIILIGVNIAYMYLTSLIIFKLTGSKQLTREAIESVRKNTARLVAFLLVGFAVWVTSVVWFIDVPYWADWSVYVTLFVCSFSFVWTVVVAAVAGSLTQIYGETGMEVSQDQFPMVGNPQQRFRHQDPPRYDRQSREPIYAHPKRNTSGAPVHGRVSPWADHI
ncbi:uncharacterized protein LOC122248126 isoform X2 [Penaeus japonicus]|uniref:uncharacterized protein LOC122248126 isoform X2 n=1 Tax=Penaeus japonicus TaxID=27405 RepID=UPI001C70ED6F|nr:uncharacterized protein LOC122248126 isoform X2 [Penaeus japonicus]